MKYRFIPFQSVLLVGTLLLLGACKKNEEIQIQYPVVFVADRIITKSEIQMCTPEGIKRVSTEYRALAESLPFFYPENWIELGEPYLSLQSDETAQFHGEFPGDFSFGKDGGQWKFISVGNVYVSNWEMDILATKIPRYREPLTSIPVIGTYHFITKEVRIATGDLNEMRIPIVSYYFARIDDHGFQSAGYHYHNEFDETVLAELRDSDLLFIQKYELVCKAVR